MTNTSKSALGTWRLIPEIFSHDELSVRPVQISTLPVINEPQLACTCAVPQLVTELMLELATVKWGKRRYLCTVFVKVFKHTPKGISSIVCFYRFSLQSPFQLSSSPDLLFVKAVVYLVGQILGLVGLG